MGSLSFLCLVVLIFSPLAVLAAGLEDNRRLLGRFPDEFTFINLDEDALPKPFTIDIGPCSLKNDAPVFDPFKGKKIDRPSPKQFQMVGDRCCGTRDPEILQSCDIGDAEPKGGSFPDDTLINRDGDFVSAMSFGTWAGRRRLLDAKSKRFVNAVDIWYLGDEIKNGFGCFCPDTVMTIPASGGSSTKSSVKITKTPGGR